MEMEEKLVEIYSDGACSGNPGPGGWGCILIYGDREKELYGGERETTNQRMELKAVIEGLKALKVSGWQVKVYSDSAYLVNAVNKGWITNWQRNGWLTSRKEEVANRDLWEELIRLMQKNRVTFLKVKGHSGQHYNERCDALARKGAQEAKRQG